MNGLLIMFLLALGATGQADRGRSGAGMFSQLSRRSRIYINLMGWVDTKKAEFIFVVFSDGFARQYDYFINYKYLPDRKEWKLKKNERKVPHVR